MAPMQGVIDITFSVKGTKTEGVVRFNSRRAPLAKGGMWETSEYWVEVDGKRADLLEEGYFAPIVTEKSALEQEQTARGFRQVNKAS